MQVLHRNLIITAAFLTSQSMVFQRAVRREFAQSAAGVFVALGLYLFVILRAIEAARLAKDRLGAYLVLGVLASFTFQVLYNITMSAGLAPVKGLTLPLMSYGGSSMIATLAGFGLILNVRMRRFTN